MSTPPYQEEEGSVFESNGVKYDLNRIFRAVQHLPIYEIKVNRLKWVVTPEVLGHIDQARVDRADLTAPLLVTMWQGQQLPVDGMHRLVKALQLKKPTLKYRRVSKDVLDSAELGPDGKFVRPEWNRW